MQSADELWESLTPDERERFKGFFADYHRRDETIRTSLDEAQEAIREIGEAWPRMAQVYDDLLPRIDDSIARLERAGRRMEYANVLEFRGRR